MANVTITPEALAKSAASFRKEILMMPVYALGDFLKHVTLRTGIRYSETVGELTGDMQIAPYDESREDNDGVNIVARTLHTYFGDVVKNFSPNSVYQSIYGSALTKGEGLKTTNITRLVLDYLSSKVGQNLYKSVWKAKRSDTGTKTIDLFNGFDTITADEITAGNIAAGKGNFLQLDVTKIDATNAVDTLKKIWRAANEHLRDQQCKLFVPPSVLDAYNDDYKTVTGAIPYNLQYKQTFVEGSENRCEIVALANKSGSDYIHLTTKNNMLVGVNQMGEDETVAVEKHKAFVLQFIMTMFFGCQFESISPERLLVAKYKA